MPKKDAATAVLGMLSSAGAQTRPAPPSPQVVEPAAAAEQTTAPAQVNVEPVIDVRPPATVSTLPPAPGTATETAPRTLRLRAGTARALRDAWLEAKRDDVLLTAQDFASSLVDEALTRHRRQQAARSS